MSSSHPAITFPTSESTVRCHGWNPGPEQPARPNRKGQANTFAMAGADQPCARRGAGMSRTRGRVILRSGQDPGDRQQGDPCHEQGPGVFTAEATPTRMIATRNSRAVRAILRFAFTGHRRARPAPHRRVTGQEQAVRVGLGQGLVGGLDDVLRDADGGPLALAIGHLDQDPDDGAGALGRRPGRAPGSRSVPSSRARGRFARARAAARCRARPPAPAPSAVSMWRSPSERALTVASAGAPVVSCSSTRMRNDSTANSSWRHPVARRRNSSSEASAASNA